MSMNLHCKEMELLQTPSHITYMCLYIGKDKKGHYIQEKDWKAIRFRYTEWAKSSLNGVWLCKEDLDQQRLVVGEHIERLESFKKLHFFIG